MEEIVTYSESLRCNVSLTNERLLHIRAGHPEVSPAHDRLILETIRAPEKVRQSKRMTNAHLLSRWYSEVLNGKHLVVVVIVNEDRGWVATSYFTNKIADGS